MTPTTNWGDIHIVPPDFNSDGTLLTDQPSAEPTVVSVGRWSTQLIQVLPRVPFVFSLRANESAHITGRVFVTSSVKGSKNNPNSSSPYMVTIPDIIQSKSQYIIQIPEGYLTNYVTIMIIKENIKDDLRLNGQAIEEGKIRFESVLPINFFMSYTILTLEVSTGMLNITTTSGSNFSLLVFGYRYLDSYGFAGNVPSRYNCSSNSFYGCK
ncbi:uncharacterized protein LOC134249053 [Saccostrea cucullata]|uniref:uncharacterized protein LOC134249053 n=1 Tax=Saccostrea cuccullata TaxID=36930 RepID=UPI002ED6842F